MPHYHFVAVVDGEVAETEDARSFADLEEARIAARAALGRIAAGRLSHADCEFVSVEDFDGAKTPLIELRLEVRQIPK